MAFGDSVWKNYIDKNEEHRKIFDIDIVELAKTYGTPIYVLFEKIIEENYEKYDITLKNCYNNYLICYAVKANPSIHILSLLGKLGAGVDVASEYELQLALEAKIPTEKIRANGNCKTDAYITQCIENDIIINVDPEEELETIKKLARHIGKNAIINLRFSGFPIKNVTSRAITTSTNWSKFGIDYKRANLVFDKLKHGNLKLNGLMVHIGSQITDIKAYYTVLDILINLFRDAKKLEFDIKEIDLGGGLGIQYFEQNDWEIIKAKIKNTRKENYTWAYEFIGYEYNPLLDDLEWIGEELSCDETPDTFIQKLFKEKYSEEKSFKEKLLDIDAKLVIEPGRSIVGNAGITITKIGHVSKTPRGDNIVHVDMGVNAHTFGTSVPEQLHRIEIANYIKEGDEFETFVAGNLCFTGDLICKIKNKLIRKPMRGDYLLLYDTGAYSDFFTSNANSFPRPAKVIVKNDGTQKLLVKREDISEIFQREY